MDYPYDIAVKVEKEDVELDNNGNIKELLFDVEIKVEKEVFENDKSDWCVSSLGNPGDLLEPLFFKQLTENVAQECVFCHKYFPDHLSILKHNLDHLHVLINNPTLFQCDRCNSFFTNKQAMNHHISLPQCHTDYDYGPLQHENLSKTLTLKYKPKAYVPLNTPAITNGVPKYGKTYKANPNVKRLQDCMTNSLKYKPKACKLAKTKQPHKCVICNKMYTYTHWHAHMSEVHGDGGYCCGICNLEFKCERYFKNHMRKKHLQQFVAQKKMPEKKRVAKGNNRMDVNCDECDTVLQSMYALKTHKRTVHSSEKYVCNICNSTLKCKSYLLAHLRRVHYDDGTMHACYCGKKFRSPRYLAVHKKNAHSKKK